MTVTYNAESHVNYVSIEKPLLSLIPDYKPCYIFPFIRPIAAPAEIQFVPDDNVEAVEEINVGDIGNINDIIQEIPYNNAAGQNNYVQINNNQPITLGPGKTEYLRGYNEVGLPPGDVIKRRRRSANFLNVIYQNVQPCCNDLFDRLEDLTQVQAERRARKLLRKHLTKDEYEEYRTKGYFFVISNKGNHFKLESGKLPLQYLNRIDKDHYLTHCIYLGEYHGDFPPADQLLAWKLILENDEDQLLKIANSTPGPTHPDWRDYTVTCDAPAIGALVWADEYEKDTANQDIHVNEFEILLMEWMQELGNIQHTENDLIITRHLHDSYGFSEVPPWHWDDEHHGGVHEELIGLYSEFPRVTC